MKKKCFLICLIAYIVTLCTGRILLNKNIYEQVTFQESILPIILDMSFALLLIIITLIIMKYSRVFATIFIALISLYQASNMEYILAMNNVINLVDIKYVGDKEFLNGTFSHLNFLGYTVLLLVSGVFLIWTRLPKVIVNHRISFLKVMSITIFILVVVQIFVTPSNSDWKKANFTVLSLENSYHAIIASSNKGPELTANEIENFKKQIFPSGEIEQGTSLLDSKSDGINKKNVLLVVMEGIPGVYLEKTQELTGVSSKYKLKSLNRIVENSVVVPNFMTHNNQTIRGLYSILSGDYPKLTATTPKAYEYMQSPENYNKLLPKILSENGYNTSFIQAAPLEFMSKDQFMSSAGFDKVIGQDQFKYNYVPFGWGIDDKAFFEQSENFISDLNKQDKPWFTTLLTVGTHHPYAVPEDIEKQYPDRKEASIVTLDNALSGLLDYIDKSEIYKDSLILFVSDESHGIDNQPFGSNWGICLAYSPEIKKSIVNDGVFGHVDLVPSILDYLGIQDNNEFKGRSIFRSYKEERPILFASHYNGDLFYSTTKGEINQINQSGELLKLKSTNGQMFSATYTTEKMNNNEFKTLLNNYKNVADSSLINNDVQSGHLDIINEKEFLLKENEPNNITGGQYLDIPAKSIVTMKFNYKLENIESYKAVRFLLTRSYGNNVISKLIDKKNGTMYYNFYTSEELKGFSFALSITPYVKELKEERSKIDISDLSISYFKGEEKNLDTGLNSFNEYSVDNLTGGTSLVPFMQFNGNNVYPLNDKELSVFSKENGILVFGPYLSYPKGKHSLKYFVHFNEITNKEDMPLITLEITKNGGGEVLAHKTFALRDLVSDGENFIAELPFTLEEDSANMELRLRNDAYLNATITKILVESQGR